MRSTRQLIRGTIGERTIRLGLSGVAALAVVAGAASEVFLLFPKYGESLGRVYDRVVSRRRRTVREMLKELEELTGYRMHLILHRLEKRGLVTRTSRNEYRLTSRGTALVRDWTRRASRKQAWDGKWRLVAFDIPETEREERAWLRSVLRGAEYRKLQQSVYVGKFPLSEALYRDIDRRGIAPHVRLLTVGEIDEDIEELIG